MKNDIIDRYRNKLIEEGYSSSYPSKTQHFQTITQSPTYLELMVSLRLEGLEELSSEEIFNNLMSHIMYLETVAAKTGEDYYELQQKLRECQNLNTDLIREK